MAIGFDVWALHGYVECLERLGKAAELGEWRAKLTDALRYRDLPIASSCACRIDAVPTVDAGCGDCDCC